MSAPTTHPSLLSRLRSCSDSAAWREFDARYGDLVVRYCRSRGLQYSDAEDVRQHVMFSLARALPHFHYSRERGTFRGYLGQVVHRAVIDFQQRRRPTRHDVPVESVGYIPAPHNGHDHDGLWEREWITHHYRLAMNNLRATYEPKSIEAFQLLLAGESVHEVAQRFGMTEQAVHKVKQRIRDRLREMIAAQLRQEDEFVHEPAAE